MINHIKAMANSTVAAITAVLMLILSTGCKGTPKTDSRERASAEKPGVRLGAFSADSAYNYIAGQVSFGPRVPGSDGHRACRDYIVETLRRHGADSIIVQQATVEAYNGDRLPISNIIAGFNLQSAKRILLAAHWDTRPWADMETSETLRQRPIEGANDGGSGVGVLLEIARNLAAKRPSVGVDLFFIDAEDYGNSDGFGMNADTWCLGSQYWAQNMVPYKADNLPVYGILLDMVGGRNAKFHYEDFSAREATTPTIKVWSEAERLGYADLFPRSVGGAATDDHIVLTRAGIPTTDIIDISNSETTSFPATWHTHNDNLANIDRSVLQAVGETVLNVVYKEKPY